MAIHQLNLLNSPRQLISSLTFIIAFVFPTALAAIAAVDRHWAWFHACAWQRGKFYRQDETLEWLNKSIKDMRGA